MILPGEVRVVCRLPSAFEREEERERRLAIVGSALFLAGVVVFFAWVLF